MPESAVGICMDAHRVVLGKSHEKSLEYGEMRRSYYKMYRNSAQTRTERNEQKGGEMSKRYEQLRRDER